jgi:hypothetical protein
VFKFGGDAGRKYLNGLNQSIVVSNIEPAPQFKSLIFPVGNCNVSVIGYLDDTELVSRWLVCSLARLSYELGTGAVFHNLSAPTNPLHSSCNSVNSLP